jgi:hypothetical protein
VLYCTMDCYVCLEECDHKSPCQCRTSVHEKCLHDVKQYHKKKCTICRSKYTDTSSEDSEDEDSEDEDEDSEISAGYGRQTMCYIGIIVAFIIYLILYTINTV